MSRATGLDFGPSDTATRVAIATSALATLLLGGYTGVGLPTVVTLTGVLAVVVGQHRLADATPRERVGGSVAYVGGAVLSLVGVGWALAVAPSGALVPFCGGFAVAVLGANAVPTTTADGFTVAAAGRSAGLLVLVAALGLAVYVGVLRTLALGLVRGGAVLTSWAPMLSVVLVQVLVLAIALLVPPAQRLLDEWLPGERTALPVLDRQGLTVHTVPRPYWLALVAQLAVALYLPGVFDWFLRLLGPVGAAVRFLLLSGVIVVPLVGVVLAIGQVFLARGLQLAVVVFVDGDPPGAAADCAGGLAVALVGGGGLLVLTLLGRVPGALAPAVGEVGAVALATGVGAVAAFVAMFLDLAVAGFHEDHALPGRSEAGTVAAGLVLLATLATAATGAPLLPVVAGVVAALLVWDAQSYGSALGHDVTAGAETGRSELVHLTGTVLVLAVAAAVVVGGTLFLLPTLGAVAAWQGSLALVASLVAVLAFGASAALG